MKSIKRLIFETLAGKLSISTKDIALDSHLIEDLGADSLDLVEVMLELEDKYSVSIPDEKAEELIYVRDIVNYIQAEGYTLRNI